jgi:hypothetical protein
MHRTESGQSLAQSGTALWSLAQQGMPSGIDAIACAATAGATDDDAKGASTSPKRLSASKRRLIIDQGFIGVNISQLSGLG